METDPGGSNPGSAREAWTRPTARIDWLAGRISDEAPDDGTDAAAAWLDQPSEPCTADAGFRGYDWWRKDANGTKIAREISKDRYGDRLGGFERTYLILKGSGLTALRDRGVDDQAAFKRFRAWDGRCSRIDLALDVKHPDVTPKAFYDLHQGRRFLTRFRDVSFWGDRDAGQTFYLSGKDQTFRVYDKSAERKRKQIAIEDGITRMELELRGSWASRAARDLSKLAAGPDWTTTFPAFVSGLILGKARPLDAKCPARNPQRAPVWKPLAEALRDLGVVRLSNDERTRALLEKIGGKCQHFANDQGANAFMLKLLGEARYLQYVRTGSVDNEGMVLLGLAQMKTTELSGMLTRFGIPNLDAPGDLEDEDFDWATGEPR
jgi:hypothetical protein